VDRCASNSAHPPRHNPPPTTRLRPILLILRHARAASVVRTLESQRQDLKDVQAFQHERIVALAAQEQESTASTLTLSEQLAKAELEMTQTIREAAQSMLRLEFEVEDARAACVRILMHAVLLLLPPRLLAAGASFWLLLAAAGCAGECYAHAWHASCFDRPSSS
jgi:hypothetical protein